MIQALIFDFDGLILDTEVPDYQSWQEVFRSFGCDLPLAEWAAGIGRPVGAFDVYACLEQQLGRPVDRLAVYAIRRRRYLELIEAQPVRPGVIGYLAEARRRGLRLGIASSSDREWVTGHLARVGLLAEFDGIRCLEDVTRAKPDPELYYAALEMLGVAPARAIALEDSPNGILAAKRAGLFCVAVPNPLTEQLHLEHADLRVPSLAELPLGELLRAAGERVNG